MPTNFLWSGSGAYGLTVTNVLTTQLNALATSSANTLCAPGSAIQNTGSWIYADFEFVSGGSITPTSGAFIEVWLLRSIDGGTNYEAGSATQAPARMADAIIPFPAATGTWRVSVAGVILPPGFFKPIVRNQLGVAMSSTSNILRYAAYSEQY